MVTENLASLRAELANVGPDRFTARDYRPGTVTHIVLFRFGAATDAAARAELVRRFHELAATERGGGPYIRSIVSGPQLSGEASDDGFEHAFVVTFDSLGDRNFYVGEPVIDDPRYLDGVHAQFKTFAGPLLADDGALVFDFAAGQGPTEA
jgi:hypothetical protein